MSQEQTPLWTPNFILISLVNFQLVLVFYLLVIVIVGYSVAELGATTAQAGLVSGLFIVGTLFGRLIIGKLLNRLGLKITLVAGLTGFLLFSGLYLIPAKLEILLGIRLMHGFMMGVASTVLGTVIAQTIPATRRGEGIGYFSMSSTLGTAIGPFLGIWLMSNFNYQVIFVFTSVVALSCLICSLFIQPPQIKITNPVNHIENQSSSRLAQYIEPKALPISMIVLIVATCYSGVLSFIHFYAKEINLVETASFFFLMYAIAILLSRPFTGPLMDRRGENIIIYPAIVIMALGILLLSQAHNATMLLASAALLGFGFGNLQSVCQTIAVKSTSLQRMGLATSTFFIALDAGLGFGPYFLGMLLDQIGYRQLYLYSAVLTISCLIWYYLLHGRKAGEIQPSY
ncbi:MFS transporter [Acinetobacter pseudolwoffii]|uniref:MFS transporter n=1 Tax=Acinetobacter pseudolwoffii TaxID=2053287 RepID=A0A2H9UM42_9GAMM|nr:MFS transporter [Acinetobacter pseudolwoffii]MCO8090927.1 MFS transporter [Acinetobacter pseudolwoffii]PJI32700.1 MFS transporter [Acinetobacter pseudolwoffii]